MTEKEAMELLDKARGHNNRGWVTHELVKVVQEAYRRGRESLR